jgi:hypothetical protein
MSTQPVTAAPTTIDTIANLEDVEVSVALRTDAYSFSRLISAFERDREVTGHEDSFNDWLLNIAFDWVEEVEKPTPIR